MPTVPSSQKIFNINQRDHKIVSIFSILVDNSDKEFSIIPDPVYDPSNEINIAKMELF